jgi:hypothetical protein
MSRVPLAGDCLGTSGDETKMLPLGPKQRSVASTSHQCKSHSKLFVPSSFLRVRLRATPKNFQTLIAFGVFSQRLLCVFPEHSLLFPKVRKGNRLIRGTTGDGVPAQRFPEITRVRLHRGRVVRLAQKQGTASPAEFPLFAVAWNALGFPEEKKILNS